MTNVQKVEYTVAVNDLITFGFQVSGYLPKLFQDFYFPLHGLTQVFKPFFGGLGNGLLIPDGGYPPVVDVIQ